MGVLDRLSTLLRANINDMLDQAEDPEIMLNQILRDMEGEINKARSQVAEMMAQERIFSDDLNSAKGQASHMEERAEYYVRQGDDTMAKEALKRKADIILNVEGIAVTTAADLAKIRERTSRLGSAAPVTMTVLRAGRQLKLAGKMP